VERIQRQFVPGAVSVADSSPQAAPASRPTGGALLAAARARAWNYSPRVVQLKRALTEAGKLVGGEKQWPQLRAQVLDCIPKDERAAKLRLALDDNIQRADQASVKGDGDAYKLAMRRLWTAFAFLDF